VADALLMRLKDSSKDETDQALLQTARLSMSESDAQRTETVWRRLQSFPHIFAVAEARGTLDDLTLEGVQAAERTTETQRRVRETPDSTLPETSAKPTLTGAKRLRFRMNRALPSQGASVSTAASGADNEEPEPTDDQRTVPNVATAMKAPATRRARFRFPAKDTTAESTATTAHPAAEPTERSETQTRPKDTPVSNTSAVGSLLKRRKTSGPPSTETTHRTPSSSAAEPQGTPTLAENFWERQQANRCGMHAINNVLGSRVCESTDLEATLSLMAFEAQFPDAENVEAAPFDAAMHMDDTGNYSEELLAKFLETRTAFRLEFAALTPATMHLLQTDVFHAALVHLPGHWTALRWTEGAWRYLDSLRAGPEIWTTEDVERLLRRDTVRALPMRRQVA
jgi:hypothetical protein